MQVPVFPKLKQIMSMEKLFPLRKNRGKKNLQVSDKRTFKMQQQARHEEGVGPMVTG